MRCSWAQGDELRGYHDEEWGVPVHDDSRLFELMTLEGAQAGLSWLTVLRRREGYRRAFAGFDPRLVVAFGPGDVTKLLADEGIIRHRGKIESTINNARAVLEVQASHGSLDGLLWSYVDGVPRQHVWSAEPDVASSSAHSIAMSMDLKRLGFRFLGPTTCYALMQAAGLVNDHHESCFRFSQVSVLR